MCFQLFKIGTVIAHRGISPDIPEALRGTRMLKITRTQNGGVIVKLSGRMDAENVNELETLLRSETNDHRIALDLTDLTLVDQDAVSFLGRCEADGIQLKNCPIYIREWINGEHQ
jgi:hypothetical protein